jgi:transcriptional regulator with XRE-family HTH domain
VKIIGIDIFGRRLAAIRVARGLTQAELAFAIGKPKQTLSRWENTDRNEVCYGDARRCARALRCRVSDLEALPDAPLPGAPSNWGRIRRRIKLYWRQAPPSGRGDQKSKSRAATPIARQFSELGIASIQDACESEAQLAAGGGLSSRPVTRA